MPEAPRFFAPVWALGPCTHAQREVEERESRGEVEERESQGGRAAESAGEEPRQGWPKIDARNFTQLLVLGLILRDGLFHVGLLLFLEVDQAFLARLLVHQLAGYPKTVREN